MEMREILFRGKRVDNGERVEGFYVVIAGENHYIFTGRIDLTQGSIGCEYFKVDSKTVCRYTGLTDKNGVKIFEGDIVKEYKTKDKVKGVVKFGEYQSGINKYADDLGFYVEWTTENFLIQELGYWCRKNMLEVIGNVHDNPELLEGSNK